MVNNWLIRAAPIHDGQARHSLPRRDPRPRPELRIWNAAAQTRMVSVARIRLDFWKSVRRLKWILPDDISEFESHMPSHAVRSLPAGAHRAVAHRREQAFEEALPSHR